ncbi:dihydropteroate synthase [Desulfovibrio sp. OttesenSCG-928-A18]|nr:dihydropteroate synthase [Desulfovibrio sp. OttesenSCG-928-A18]
MPEFLYPGRSAVTEQTGNALVWQLRGGRRLTLAPFLVAGILNITPDSFSDGGLYAAPGAILKRAGEHLAAGAGMLDLGAESTRPGAEDIGHAEEWRRLEPALRDCLDLRCRSLPEPAALEGDGMKAPALPFALSVDSFRAETAKKALELTPGEDALALARTRGIAQPPLLDVINDVSGGSFDPAMPEILAQYKPGYVLGHSPDRPAVMQEKARYDNVVDTLLHWFASRMELLVGCGLPEACICLDPCIGFGKSPEHALEIIAAIPRLLTLGRPLYFGVSRKSLLGAFTGQAPRDRDGATQVLTALLAGAGVAVHRVHDTRGAVAALQITGALRARVSFGGTARHLFATEEELS